MKKAVGELLMVLWLRLCTPKARDVVWSLGWEEPRSHMLHVMAKKLKNLKKKMKEKKGLQVFGKSRCPQKGCFPAPKWSVHIWRLCCAQSGLQATHTFGVWTWTKCHRAAPVFFTPPLHPAPVQLTSGWKSSSFKTSGLTGCTNHVVSHTPTVSPAPGKPVLTAAGFLFACFLLFSFHFIPNYIPLNLWLASF